MTPTEATIRAHVAASLTDDLQLDPEVEDRLSEVRCAFEGIIDGDHITDEDYSVYSRAALVALRARMPDIEAALRPILVDVQTEAVVAFFRHFPDAPLAEREPVPA
jgi:hypothetical protein